MNADVIFIIVLFTSIGVYIISFFYMCIRQKHYLSDEEKHEENLRKFYEKRVLPEQRRKAKEEMKHYNDKSPSYNTDSNSSRDETV